MHYAVTEFHETHQIRVRGHLVTDEMTPCAQILTR